MNPLFKALFQHSVYIYVCVCVCVCVYVCMYAYIYVLSQFRVSDCRRRVDW
jgi:hypothetical protein